MNKEASSQKLDLHKDTFTMKIGFIHSHPQYSKQRPTFEFLETSHNIIVSGILDFFFWFNSYWGSLWFRWFWGIIAMNLWSNFIYGRVKLLNLRSQYFAGLLISSNHWKQENEWIVNQWQEHVHIITTNYVYLKQEMIANSLWWFQTPPAPSPIPIP